jgi:hypothetical protein
VALDFSLQAFEHASNDYDNHEFSVSTSSLSWPPDQWRGQMPVVTPRHVTESAAAGSHLRTEVRVH